MIIEWTKIAKHVSIVPPSPYPVPVTVPVFLLFLVQLLPAHPVIITPFINFCQAELLAWFAWHSAQIYWNFWGTFFTTKKFYFYLYNGIGWSTLRAFSLMLRIWNFWDCELFGRLDTCIEIQNQIYLLMSIRDPM